MADRLVRAIELAEAKLTKAQMMRRRTRMERQLTPKLATAFMRQGAAVLETLGAHASEFPERVQESFRLRAWAAIWASVAGDTEGLFIAPIQRGVQDALVTGALQQIAAFGADIAFTVDSPRAQAFLDAYAAAQVRGINETTRDQLKTIIANGLKNTLSYSDIAEQISTRFAEFAGRVKGPKHIRSRAELISVTEIGNAYAEGNRMGVLELKDAGLAMQKRWLTRGDARVSAGCRANERAGWISIDAEYPSGDLRPLRFPGCRCDEQYRRTPKGGN